MKTLIPFLFLVASCATTSQSRFAPTPVSGEPVLLVHGLSCPLCASNLYDELNAIPGVENSWGDLDTGRIHVEVSPQQTVTERQLDQAVRDAGFTLKSISTP